MFFILKTGYLTGYDNTPFAVAENIKDVMRSLEEVGENLNTWFAVNQMKLNSDKCHLLLNTKEQNTFKIGNLHIKNSLFVKLLGTKFDHKLNFVKHSILNIFAKKHQES